MTHATWPERFSLLLISGLTLAGACGDDDDGLGADRPAIDAGRADAGTGTDAGELEPDAGPSVRDGSVPPSDAGAPPSGATTTAPPEALERMVGSFALESTYATIAEVPFLGDQENFARAWGLVDVVAVGDTLQMTERGCHVELEGSGASIADAVPRSTPPRTVTLEFATEAGGVRWIRPAAPFAIGWTPDGPADVLPTSADDPRVIDQDGDGQPGITVHVEGLATGDIYVVQWQRDWYDGPLTAEGPIEGTNHGEDGEQNTIGASNGLLEMEVTNRPNPDTSLNRVRLVPIDPGYDCDRLMAESATLFP